MPVQDCRIDGVRGYQWGGDGKCYVGPGARRKAEEQGRAIEERGYVGSASLSVVIGAEPPSEFVIFALGTISTSKGDFVFDDTAADRVMRAFQAHGADRLPIDFDHGMLAAIKTPETSVAAGWFAPAIIDNKLMATRVEWTERAAAMLRSREFRFLSPAFNYDRKTGQITQLLNVALTNLPATRDADPLVANKTENVPPLDLAEAANKKEGEEVSEKILAILGAATEDEAVNITKELNQWSQCVLAATGTETLDAAMAAIKLSSELPGKVAELSQQIEALADEKRAQEREQLIGKLSEDGKLPPGLHEWARRQ